MFDAALATPRGRPVAEPSKRRPAIHPAALAGALLLHLAGFALLAWAAASREPRLAEEPPAIELTLETVAAAAPAPEAAPPEPEPEAPPPEPEPPAPPEPPPVESPPTPPVRAEAAAPPPPPAPRPRPPPPPRERRASPAPPGTAPSTAPPTPAPAAPSGPPVFTNARFRRTPTPPEYPLVARERGITGTALVRALVGVDGETREVRLHRSSGHDILDGAALAAVRRWSFEPSAREGQRLESWIEVPIRFQLR
ncbi:energy transducer TonB [Roseococcus sp. SYP-B2431]|uniref:energy transducer TonB n=1 Tax=Roseococcus sp. SYP-B2431 TaxID=2496640 RepID=UPI0010386CAC|nr:energy transducer TonB [Roseococcus sp. SYP-B2431]TCH98066.1 energy transducer TonB [Roseococcus sp. SYP-B2431]